MESIELQPLFNNYHRKIARIDLRFKRYLYDLKSYRKCDYTGIIV